MLELSCSIEIVHDVRGLNEEQNEGAVLWNGMRYKQNFTCTNKCYFLLNNISQCKPSNQLISSHFASHISYTLLQAPLYTPCAVVR